MLADAAVVGCCNNFVELGALLSRMHNLSYHTEPFEPPTEPTSLTIGKLLLMMGVGLEGVTMKGLPNVPLVTHDSNVVSALPVPIGHDGRSSLVGYTGFWTCTDYDPLTSALESPSWTMVDEWLVLVSTEGGHSEWSCDPEYDGCLASVSWSGHCTNEWPVMMHPGCTPSYLDAAPILETSKFEL